MGSGTKAPPWRRWTSVVLRAAHLVAVIGFAAGFLASGNAPTTWTLAVLLTGTALFLLDFATAPGRLMEASAWSVGAKLILIGLMAAVPGWEIPLFWTVVVWSVIFAHAPASFRHARLRAGRRG